MAIAQLLVPTAYGHWSLVFFLIKAPRMVSVLICEIRGRINTFCLFFSALRA